MTIFEFTNRVDVITPHGPGAIWFVTQFGHETHLVFCVIQSDGSLREWPPRDIQITNNETFGRKIGPFKST
jgi:hypothetical protein